MSLFAAGLSFKTAPVALREQLAVAPSDRAEISRRLMAAGGLSEVVLLWTCNRVEIYGVAGDPVAALAPLFGCLTNLPLRVGAEIYFHEGEEAARHLFRVVSGLDSMVLGETEIAGQVKAAYELAHGAGLTGKHLNKTFQKSLEVAKEIRTSTGIGKGATSVGSVAVRHAQRMFGAALPDKRVMVIGAGQMAEACIRHLIKQGVKTVLVANRSIERAQQLAGTFGGTAVAFDQFSEHMADIDIVISSTGCPHTIIHRRHIEGAMAQRADRPLVVVDIAVPRDVDPDLKNVPGVHLFDIDDLQDTVRENVQRREQDLALCDGIIAERARALLALFTRSVPPVEALCAT